MFFSAEANVAVYLLKSHRANKRWGQVSQMIDSYFFKFSHLSLEKEARRSSHHSLAAHPVTVTDTFSSAAVAAMTDAAIFCQHLVISDHPLPCGWVALTSNRSHRSILAFHTRCFIGIFFRSTCSEQICAALMSTPAVISIYFFLHVTLESSCFWWIKYFKLGSNGSA